MRFRQQDPLRREWNPHAQFARKCGSCTVCCSAPEIREGDFHKPLGVPCQHLCESGCSLFGQSERPNVCGIFACNWLRGDGSVNQRPDRMKALPVLAADRGQLTLYLMDGSTPENLTREARSYIRRWHRKRKTAVLLVHGEDYGTITAIWPDGEVREAPTEVVGNE